MREQGVWRRGKRKERWEGGREVEKVMSCFSSTPPVKALSLSELSKVWGATADLNGDATSCDVFNFNSSLKKDVTFWLANDNLLSPRVQSGQRLDTTSFKNPFQSLSFQTIPLFPMHSQQFHAILDYCIAFLTIPFKTITARSQCNLPWFQPWQAIYPSNNLTVKNNECRYSQPKKKRWRMRKKNITGCTRKETEEANDGKRQR